MRILPALVRLLQRVFAPEGNLLVTDLLAEVTIHILANGTHKTMLSKLGTQAQAHPVIQALVLAGIEVAKQHGVSINWVAMNHLAPYQGTVPCALCHAAILSTEPAVWVMRPPKIGHLRCVVIVTDTPEAAHA